ncbi:HU family DNA-binding protein [Paenibacillus oleatilyticus]|uniref:HU family DNA-binding protein n=1 Tax=Paenibacillus oleatilyticus TaxID=2594886 RepID=UPI001C1F5453|nr:HU family DNA-binding protein [Paenibacillus oleatilyticus]MBU7316131.1 HU family DNA-binding protein [Paenibacillus oleatilyticus]
MNKQELVNRVVEKTGLTKKDATSVVEAVFTTINETLVTGEEVSITGHGKYAVRERAARTGVNPLLLKELKEKGVDPETAKAQASIQIEASKTVSWKPAKAVKEMFK